MCIRDSHARDIFLDKSYRQENGRKGFYTSFYEITDYVQDLFQELNGEQMCIRDRAMVVRLIFTPRCSKSFS